MVQITRGYSFGDTEEVSPTKLNNLIDLATLTGLGYTNFAGSGQAAVFAYGATEPTRQRGLIWYDTTPGSEGCKFAIMSPSNASLSKWLRAMPAREGVYWTMSGASLGYPMFLYRGGQGGPVSGYLAPATVPGAGASAALGTDYVTFDGLQIPCIWRFDSSSGMTAAMVIPTENVVGPGPVVCAWSGLVRCQFSNNPLAVNDPVYTALTNSQVFTSGTPAAKANVWGVQMEAWSQAGSPAFPTVLLWGTGPAIEDYS